MDIKRKKKEKRIQLLGGLMGICVAVVSLFYFFHVEKTEAEKRMVEIVNYVKVQCSTYTHYSALENSLINVPYEMGLFVEKHFKVYGSILKVVSTKRDKAKTIYINLGYDDPTKTGRSKFNL